ncbi:hypothetical protein [Alkalihalobacillus pseudalcaliphilus]|uniref:hypothetical protein n=1 Tax=Alkalihalobacillus pseudalcaliphilus TaxID=79884 RepID=UPI00064D8792|nr:hypothetical protein [Alkalihalobacillus pseudalcaliphilus]KMK75106.1 hypothetical protein AB990_16790 [Alkalihalobacillus pseudalcaliphilus]
MKKMILFLIAVLFLFACADRDVQDDIINYYNEEMPAIEPAETQVLNDFDQLLASNLLDEEVQNGITEDIIPRYESVVEDFRNLPIETEPLQEVHDLYIEFSETQLAAIGLTADAYKGQDASIIEEVNSLLDEALTLNQQFQEELEKLFDEYNIEIEEVE